GITALRLEGTAASVEHRMWALRAELQSFGEAEELHSRNSRMFWREIRDVRPFVGQEKVPNVWRLSVPPSAGSKTAFAILEECRGEVFYDWGGGLIWLALAPLTDAGAATVRKFVGVAGGHATLVRAGRDVRARVAVFQPLEGATATVVKGIKDGFDPNGVLNPGRMYEGI
ncbi:MAG: 2-hydroxy-acid oxidase, partial [Proteobacteria bacterium]|nr:2-hydroxy-acid oxidase [Pseudomonadota bacterium]